MRAREIGFAYLMAILGDVALSALANVDESLTTASNLWSALVMASGTVVFMMAVLGRLRPAAAFIVPAVLYAALMVFGFFIGIALAVKGGGHVPQRMTATYIASVLPWWTTVNWLLIGLNGLTAVACLIAVAVASKRPQETRPVAPVLTR